MNIKTKDITKDIPVAEHIKDVEDLVRSLLPFHEHREATYKMSFAKRGEIGVWMNLARKYDRMDGLMEKIISGDESVRLTLIDTLVDLALYALKWLAIIIAYDYTSWESWTAANDVAYQESEGPYDEDDEASGSIDPIYAVNNNNNLIGGTMSGRFESHSIRITPKDIPDIR